MSYTVVDIETTGMDPTRDQIVEVAAVWRSAGVLSWRTGLCLPSVPIPPEVRAVHHITQDMVARKSPPEVVVSEVTGGRSGYLVAHHAAFDRPFLEAASTDLCGRDWICTYRCARHLFPDAPGFSNQTLRYWLSDQDLLRMPHGCEPALELPPHRALPDAVVTEAILHTLLGEVGGDWAELLRLTSAPVVERTCGFGKHRGILWTEVPRDYLQWILRQRDMDADVVHTARTILRV